MEALHTFAARLKSRREALNLSQAQLGKAIGVHRSSISAYEDKKRTPTANVFMDMAETLQVSPKWLMGLSDVMKGCVHVPVYKLPSQGNILETPENMAMTEPTTYDENIGFCVIVEDDSMQGVRIYPGDIVCIKKDHSFHSGEVVVINHPEQGLMIRRILYTQDKGEVTLHAEKGDVMDQVFTKEQWQEDWVIGKVAYAKMGKIR